MNTKRLLFYTSFFFIKHFFLQPNIYVQAEDTRTGGSDVQIHTYMINQCENVKWLLVPSFHTEVQ